MVCTFSARIGSAPWLWRANWTIRLGSRLLASALAELPPVYGAVAVPERDPGSIVFVTATICVVYFRSPISCSSAARSIM